MAYTSPGRTLRIGLQGEWDPHSAGPGHQGLLAWDPRVRTLLRWERRNEGEAEEDGGDARFEHALVVEVVGDLGGERLPLAES